MAEHVTPGPPSDDLPHDHDEDSVRSLLGQWLFGLRVGHRVHTRSAAIAHRRGRILGTAAAVLAGIAGTTAFSSLQTTADDSVWPALIVGTFSILAAILASLQAYLGLDQVAERHRVAAHRYGALRREIEVLLTGPMQVAGGTLDALRETWDAIDLESPPLSQRRYDRVVEQLKSK